MKGTGRFRGERGLWGVTETEEKIRGFSLVESWEKLRSEAQENSAGGVEDFSLVVSPIIGAKEFTFRWDLNDLSSRSTTGSWAPDWLGLIQPLSGLIIWSPERRFTGVKMDWVGNCTDWRKRNQMASQIIGDFSDQNVRHFNSELLACYARHLAPAPRRLRLIVRQGDRGLNIWPDGSVGVPWLTGRL